MKNPFKGLGDKLKTMRDKFSAARKHESAKMVVDGVGDSSIIGGIALVGTAAFLPAAPVTVLVAGGLFIAAGATAKFVAGKMKPDAYDVTNPPEAKAANENTPAASTLKAKGPAPEFRNAADKKQVLPTEKPAAKPAPAPRP